jgi:Ca2+-binding RTX toxin-like protein
MKKRAILLLTMMAAALLVASGVALAVSISCPNRPDSLGYHLCVGSSNSDTMTGTASRDRMYGYGGNDVILGENGNDSLVGMDGNDTILGGDGNDYMSGSSGDDRLLGGSGEDLFVDWNGNDKMYDTMTTVNTYEGTDDTYLGMRGDGHDEITDFGGVFDTLDLSHLTRSQVFIAWQDMDGNRYLDALLLERKGTTHTVLVRNYFDNTSARGRGKGEMRIKFEDKTVGFPASEG